LEKSGKGGRRRDLDPPEVNKSKQPWSRGGPNMAHLQGEGPDPSVQRKDCVGGRKVRTAPPGGEQREKKKTSVPQRDKLGKSKGPLSWGGDRSPTSKQKKKLRKRNKTTEPENKTLPRKTKSNGRPHCRDEIEREW